MFIIGIAGGTGSGKTTVVKKLIERLPKGEVVVIPQDSYYKDSSHVPVEERQNINFDHPDAFDWHLLAKQIAQLKEGEAIEQPIYDYLTCTRQPETIHIEPREIIVIEGIMALSDKKLRQQMDLKIFVDADADDRLIRVVQRDIVERGRTLADAIVILDEAQNTTTAQLKMFLTRLGINGKMIITGDLTQIDLPAAQKSGLRDAIERLQDIRGIAIVEFNQKDIVRHPLVKQIVEAYKP